MRRIMLGVLAASLSLAAAFAVWSVAAHRAAPPLPAMSSVRAALTHRPRPIAVLRGHTDKVEMVAFSPDGKTLASGSDDDTIRLWALGG